MPWCACAQARPGKVNSKHVTNLSGMLWSRSVSTHTYVVEVALGHFLVMEDKNKESHSTYTTCVPLSEY